MATHGMCLVKKIEFASCFRLKVPTKAYANDVTITILYHPAAGGARPPGRWDGIARPVLNGNPTSDTLHVRVHCSDETSIFQGGGETGQVDITITDPQTAGNTSTEQLTDVGILV